MTKTIWWCEEHNCQGTADAYYQGTYDPYCLGVDQGYVRPGDCRMVQMRLVPADEVLSNPKPTIEGTR